MFVSPNNVQLHTGYSVDVHAAESSVKLQIAATAPTAHAEAVGHWARERDLQISAPKPHIALFTSDTHKSHFHSSVVLNNTPQTTRGNSRAPPHLHLSYPNSSRESLSQAQNPEGSLRHNMGAAEGDYHLVWSISTYAALIWFLIAFQDSLRRLQAIKNTAFKIATGCHQRASSAHLHTEIRTLQTENSLGLLCRHYLAKALCLSHQFQVIVSQSSGPCIKKQTLQP